MKNFPWLTLLLVLCLPSQALAAVMAKCEQHLSRHTTHNVHVEPPTADCHGNTASTQSPAADTDSAFSITAVTDNPLCFHCDGACQNLKPLRLNAGLQNVFTAEGHKFPRLDRTTETGFRGPPLRPPCLIILS